MTADGKKRQVGLENAVKLLHTPTSKANQGSPSMAQRDAGSWFLTKDNLLTTPCADDTGLRTERYQQGGTALSMQVAAMEGMLPESAASDHKGSSQEGQRRGQLSGVEVGLYGTPTAAMKHRSQEHAEGRAPNPKEIANGTGMKLNPDFVLHMMGFPRGYLDLED